MVFATREHYGVVVPIELEREHVWHHVAALAPGRRGHEVLRVYPTIPGDHGMPGRDPDSVEAADFLVELGPRGVVGPDLRHPAVPQERAHGVADAAVPDWLHGAIRL